MKEQIVVPQIGESVSEAQISRWLATSDQYVNKDQDIVEIDSDKTTITISAPVAGKLNILVNEGTTVKIGQLIAEIDTEAMPNVAEIKQNEVELQPEQIQQTSENQNQQENSNESVAFAISPLAMSKIKHENINPQDVIDFIKKYRIGIKEVNDFIEHITSSAEKCSVDRAEMRTTDRKPMSPLRKKLSQRLVAVKNQTAMLTTFNEIDMSKLIELRKRFQEDFQKKHGVRLGFMSFFASACASALMKFPSVNAMIDGDEIVYYHYADISIAVSTDKGLVVPVLRNVNNKTIPQIEKEIAELAEKARNYKLVPADFEGGTFTITNGGVFGSLLSTPIINPPQTAILGMHAIQERAVVINGKIEVRPMMYVALSYDHRLIDGRESVGFVIEVKRLVENPELMFFESGDIYSKLLDL